MTRAIRFALFWLSMWTAVGATSAPSAAATEAHYVTEAEIGVVLLDGTYRFDLQGLSGTVDLTTASTGHVTGEAWLRGYRFPVTGEIRLRQRSARLALRGLVNNQPFLFRAKLKGGAFVGSGTLGTVAVPGRLEVGDTQPTIAAIEVNVGVAPDGKATGSAVMRAARQRIDLTLAGEVPANGDGRLTLVGNGVKVKLWNPRLTTEQLESPAWTIRGFGARRHTAGVPLRFAPAANRSK